MCIQPIPPKAPLSCQMCGNTTQGEVQLFTYAGEYTPRPECIAINKCFERSLANFKKNIPFLPLDKPNTMV